MLGFSINVLTLFALVLAIGIVVDDAIVVIENIERIMADEECLPPRLAADRAIRQVAGALIAIVLVLCAVFVPVAFMGGVTGEMFKQFAMTIVIAVRAVGHRGADAHAGPLRPAPQGLQRGAHHGLLRLRSTVGSSRVTDGYVERRRARAGPSQAVARGVRGHGGTGDRCSGSGCRPPSSLPKTRATSPSPAAARRRVAAAHQEGGPAGRGISHEEPAVVNIVAFAGLDVLTRTNQTNSATIFILLKPWDERGKDEIDRRDHQAN